MIFKITQKMRSQDTLTAALGYAEAGVPIFPAWGIQNGKCACLDKRCARAGKHPITKHGVKDATTDKDQIRKWWRKHPTANIGSPLISGVSVIDVDGPAGKESAKKLRLQDLETVKVKTGRGYHKYVFAALETRTGILTGIDLKAGGSNCYVILPPSNHISGEKYAFGINDNICKLPEAIAQALNLHSQDRKKYTTLFNEGTRNTNLFGIACSLRWKKVDAGTAEEVLRIINKKKCTPPIKNSEVINIINSAYQYGDEKRAEFIKLSDIEAKDVEWLWHPYIPKGEITILEGDPGVGKSYFTMALASIVSKGHKFPDGAKCSAGQVLILSAEDKASTILRPRLEACNADLNNIWVPDQRISFDKSGLDLLTEKIIESKPLLVIIDPLFAFTGKDMDAYRPNEVAAFLADIDNIADMFGSAILTVRHLNKSDNSKAMYRGQGSIAITGTVRSALTLGQVPNNQSLKGVAHIKHNYSAPGKTILFELADVNKKWPMVQWKGFSDLTAQDLIGAPDQKAQDIVKDKLSALLVSGEKNISEIEESFPNGPSRSTLIRSLKELGAIQTGKGPTTKWSIAS